MPEINGLDVRSVLLEVIRDNTPRDPDRGNLQRNTVMNQAADRLGVRGSIGQERTLIAEFQELFRTGYMAWGHDLMNPDPPFCFATERGREAIEWLNRDPSNPASYLGHLRSVSEVNDVAMSYINEALTCYGAGSYKAAAVMLGAATESVILELRDVVVNRIERRGERLPKQLSDWKLLTLSKAVRNHLDTLDLPRELLDEYKAYWSAFAQQIRAVRNDAGHPSSIDPITPDAVRASFLVLPEIAGLSTRLRRWLIEN